VALPPDAGKKRVKIVENAIPFEHKSKDKVKLDYPFPSKNASEPIKLNTNQ